MRFYHFSPQGKSGSVSVLDARTELASEPVYAPVTEGFVWCVLGRSELDSQLDALQSLVRSYSGQNLMQLHISDLRNAQHPSRYDYSSHYDVLIFRQLQLQAQQLQPSLGQALGSLSSLPVCFVVFERLLITVYDQSQVWGEDFLARFMQGTRLPHDPSDLMLRLVNALVDDYLNLRKMLGGRLQYWQAQLLRSNVSFNAWPALLAERSFLHDLGAVCEDQHDAMQEWLDGLQDQNSDDANGNSLQRDVLLARSRDIIGHIQRVSQYAERIEASIENAVQIHFSAQANRANAAMQLLTVIAAIFLPLNFVTGFFGMNFDALPLIHADWGVWLALLLMLLAAGAMAWFFWRKRYWVQDTDADA